MTPHPWPALLALWAQAALGAQAPPAAGGFERLPLQARLEWPLEGKPEGLCTGDFDGDGSIDLAVALVSPGKLLVWRGSPRGLAREGASRTCGDFPLPPVAAPRGTFGAGKAAQALALASRATRELELDAGEVRRIALERTPRALGTGRMLGVGTVAVACDGRRLEVLRDGAAELETWALSGDLPRCVLVSSALDAVVVGFQDSRSVEAYSASDGRALGSLQLDGIPRALGELDVDGDRERELLVAGGDHALWIVGLGTSGGAREWFDGRAPVVWHADAIPTAFVPVDLDSDQRADLALLNDFSFSLQLLSRLGAAGPERAPSYYVGQTPRGVAVLDFDADGRADFAVANRDTAGLGLIAGDGEGGLTVGTGLRLGDFPLALAARPTGPTGGTLRLAALNAKSNSISAVVADGAGLRSLDEVPCGSEPRAPQIAELDGTPGLDVLFLESGVRGADLTLYRGDAAGVLAPASRLELGGAASDLVLLDVDGDGAVELALCDPSTSTVLLSEHAAARADSAAFARSARARVPTAPRDLVVIELDGDAGPELACVLGAPGERIGVAWLEASRDGAGRLALAELGFTPLAGAPLEAASADLDGDGDQDLAVLLTRAPDSAVGAWIALLKSGAGPADFTASAPISTGLQPRALAAGDADGDGRAEVFVAIQTSTLVQCWTAAALREGPFAARALDSLGADRGPLDLCLADVDGDGLVDLCIANAFANSASILHGARR